MSKLHQSIANTVLKGLVANYEKKNPRPQLAHSKEALREVSHALKECKEFKVTEAVFKSANAHLVNEWEGSSFVYLHSERDGTYSDFKLKVSHFPDLQGSLPHSEGVYTVMVSGKWAALDLKDNSKVIKEKNEHTKAIQRYEQHIERIRYKASTQLDQVKTVQDLYLAWPEAAAFLPESAKATGVVLPVDDLNKMLDLD